MIVEIRDRKGNSASTRIDHAKGDPENPMTNEELFEKFRDVTGTVIPRNRAEEILSAAMDIDTREEILSFTKLLQIHS